MDVATGYEAKIKSISRVLPKCDIPTSTLLNPNKVPVHGNRGTCWPSYRKPTLINSKTAKCSMTDSQFVMKHTHVLTDCNSIDVYTQQAFKKDRNEEENV